MVCVPKCNIAEASEGAEMVLDQSGAYLTPRPVWMYQDLPQCLGLEDLPFELLSQYSAGCHNLIPLALIQLICTQKTGQCHMEYAGLVLHSTCGQETQSENCRL